MEDEKRLTVIRERQDHWRGTVDDLPWWHKDIDFLLDQIESLKKKLEQMATDYDADMGRL